MGKNESPYITVTQPIPRNDIIMSTTSSQSASITSSSSAGSSVGSKSSSHSTTRTRSSSHTSVSVTKSSSHSATKSHTPTESADVSHTSSASERSPNTDSRSGTTSTDSQSSTEIQITQKALPTPPPKEQINDTTNNHDSASIEAGELWKQVEFIYCTPILTFLGDRPIQKNSEKKVLVQPRSLHVIFCQNT